MTHLLLTKAPVVYGISQILVILFYGLFVEFGTGSNPKGAIDSDSSTSMHIKNHYPSFQDIHIMVFIGFGFLMCFIKSHNWSSIGQNYLVAAWAIQIEMLWSHFWSQILKYYDDPNRDFEKLNINIVTIIEADFGAAAVLISMGAIVGKSSLFQLFGMASIHIFFYAINKAIILFVFKAEDAGGSMIIHVFGAYFGVACSWFYQPKAAIKDVNNLGKGNYLSDLMSMTGTLFLFIYWPSFNGALLSGAHQQRAIINTYLSISCSCIAAIIVSRLVFRKKLQMEVILNASLAGGVVMGCNAEIIVMSYGAMLAGFLAGCVSSFGYAYLGPFLRRKINLHDTCGVHNLHGMPGFIGGITSAIVASRGSINFGSNYNDIFFFENLRTPSEQAGYQLAALGLSLGLGLFGGVVAGLITGTSSFFDPPPPDRLFDDRVAWAECEIDHHVLFELQQQYEAERSIDKSDNFRKILTNFAETIQDEQDLDSLNIERAG